MTEDGEEVACDFEPGLLFLSGKVVPVNICLRGDVCPVQDVEISGDGFGMAACSSVHDVDGLVFGLHPRSDTGMCSGGGHVSEKVRVTEYGMFSMTAKFSVVPGKLSMRAC